MGSGTQKNFRNRTIGDYMKFSFQTGLFPPIVLSNVFKFSISLIKINNELEDFL